MEISNIESAQERKFLEVKIKEGEGTNKNPTRIVTYLCEKTGKVLLREDPHDSGFKFDPEKLQETYLKDTTIKDTIQNVIKHFGWERAHKTEEVIKVIKALLEVGVDPKRCFFDDKDNLIIPISEIQKIKEKSND